MNTESLVREACRLRDNDDDEYDQVWVVFDCDDFSTEQVNNARLLAEREGIRCAISNEAFELWYLLHFIYLDTAIGRRAYIDRLTRELGRKYQKNDTDLYDILLSKQAAATRNANTLLNQYQNPKAHKQNNPSTTVHRLVEAINRFGK